MPGVGEWSLFLISGCFFLIWLEVRFEKYSNSMYLNIGKLIAVVVFAIMAVIFFTSYDFKIMCYVFYGAIGFEGFLKIIQAMIDGRKS